APPPRDPLSLHDALPIFAEAVHAARSEQARSVGDALLRRTRVGLLAAGALTRDREAARRVAQAMAPELGWDERRVDAETEAWFRLEEHTSELQSRRDLVC